jgi:hypothetical protein
VRPGLGYSDRGATPTSLGGRVGNSQKEMVSNLPDQYLRRIESIYQALQIPSNSGGLRKLARHLEASDLVPVEGYEGQHYLAPRLHANGAP